MMSSSFREGFDGRSSDRFVGDLVEGGIGDAGNSIGDSSVECSLAESS